MQKTGFWSKKRVVVVGILIALALGIYYGRGMFAGEEQQQAGFGVPVETAVVVAKPLNVTLDAVGTLVANEMVTLSPEIAGRITEIKFTEGAPVKKGDPLFKIDDRMARAELKQAESALQLARLNHERFRKLSKTGASTKLRFDEANAELGVTQANVDLSRTKLEYMTITAPFDGTVGLRKVSPGEYVNVGQELANFVSYDPMKVNFTIPETQASQLAVNQTIDFTVEALPGQKFQGVVYALDPQLDVNGRAVQLRATIPNPDNVLKPGFFARISLIVARKENALSVPESAIVPQGDTKQVFVVDAENKAQLVTVELGERVAGSVEILSGVKEGDVVVTSGQIKLQPGAPVTDLRKMAEEKAAAAPTEAAPAADTPAAAEPVAEEIHQPVEPAAEAVAPVEPVPAPTDTVPTSEEPIPTSEEPVPPSEPVDEAPVSEEGAAQ